MEDKESLSLKTTAAVIVESALAGLVLGGGIEGARRLTESFRLPRLPMVLTTGVIIHFSLNKLAKIINR